MNEQWDGDAVTCPTEVTLLLDFNAYVSLLDDIKSIPLLDENLQFPNVNLQLLRKMPQRLVIKKSGPQFVHFMRALLQLENANQSYVDIFKKYNEWVVSPVKSHIIHNGDVWTAALDEAYVPCKGDECIVSHVQYCIHDYQKEKHHSPTSLICNSSGNGKTIMLLNLTNFMSCDLLYLLTRSVGDTGVPFMHDLDTSFINAMNSIQTSNVEKRSHLTICVTEVLWRLVNACRIVCEETDSEGVNNFNGFKYRQNVHQIFVRESLCDEATCKEWLVNRQRPFIFVFDECKELDNIMLFGISLKRNLCHALRAMNESIDHFRSTMNLDDDDYKPKCFILALMTDTLSSVSTLAPTIRNDLSARPKGDFDDVDPLPMNRLKPFVDVITTDVLTDRTCETYNITPILLLPNQTRICSNADDWLKMLSESPLNHLLWLFSLGRALWGAGLTQFYKQRHDWRLETQLQNIVHIARNKLACSSQITNIDEHNRPFSSVACIGARIGIVLETGATWTDRLIAGFMAFCTDVSDSHERIQARYLAEPCLVEAASQMMHDTSQSSTVLVDIIFDLSKAVSNGAFSQGAVGEVIGRVMALLARDSCMKKEFKMGMNSFIFHQKFTVREFLIARYGDKGIAQMYSHFEELRAHGQKKASKTQAWETLLDGILTFSHFSAFAATPGHATLVGMLNRFQAAMMPPANPVFDFLYPVLLPDGRITYILEDVKCRVDWAMGKSALSATISRKNIFTDRNIEDPATPGTPYLFLYHNYGYGATNPVTLPTVSDQEQVEQAMADLEINNAEMNNENDEEQSNGKSRDTKIEHFMESTFNSTTGDDAFMFMLRGIDTQTCPFLSGPVLAAMKEFVVLEKPVYFARSHRKETSEDALERLKCTDKMAFEMACLPGKSTTLGRTLQILQPKESVSNAKTKD